MGVVVLNSLELESITRWSPVLTYLALEPIYYVCYFCFNRAIILVFIRSANNLVFVLFSFFHYHALIFVFILIL
jgi:hypothetical protein